jgi:cytochrome c oxidase subunit 4
MANEQRQAGPTPRAFRNVFVALLALLAATVGAAFLPWDRVPGGGAWGTGVALAIAAAKALLIVLYFMHVRYGPRLTWAFAGAGFLWLGILLVLTFNDYLARNHPPGVNYKGEPRYLQAPPQP